jgi:P-type Cu2+ transporter
MTEVGGHRSVQTAPRASTAVSTCPHCGTAVEGDVDLYCCRGCEMAAAIIRGAGLERYYAEREACAPRPEPLAAGWGSVPTETAADGSASARLVIDNLRCASCVWVTEAVLQRTPGVLDATVSYATGRATLHWDPARTSLPALASRIAQLGYRPRPLGTEAQPDRDLAVRLGISAFASMNIMLLSASVYTGWWEPMEPRWTMLFRWSTLVLATPVALWCAKPFFAGAWSALRRGQLHMDLPIALAVALLYVHGLAATLRSHDGYLDSLAMLVTLLLAGRMLEGRGRRRAAEAATALASTLPATARRETAHGIEVVPATALAAGDRIDLGSGEEIPADGEVVEGVGQVRMALVTGEADPVAVEPGSRVVAGALVEVGALTVVVERAGDDTLLCRMARELGQAADRGLAPTAADRIAPWFTLATLIVAAATAIGWYLAAGAGAAIAHTVAVLVVACPCALALSQPLAAAAGLGATARRGLLLRSADPLLALAEVDIVALDKTGTVTGGLPRVISASNEALRIAAGLERFSAHPIARAILAEADDRGIPLPRATDVVETAGIGIRGVIDGRLWEGRAGEAGELVLTDQDAHQFVIRLGDRVREDAARTVMRLKRNGLRVVLITGDHPDVAAAVAADCGIDEVLARRGPEEKRAWVVARQAEGHRVLLAGDGINDGAALAAADVGIAMGSGAAATVLVADGVVAGPGIEPLLAGRRAANAARRAIRTNQRRSIVYNITAVAAAAAGLVNPLVAAVLMPLSSGMVIWGALGVERAMRRLREP